MKTNRVAFVVVLCLAAALLGCPSGPLPLVAVPNLANLTREDASGAIAGAGLTVGLIIPAYNPAVSAGLVFGQSPEAGEQVARGTDVDIWVSTGSVTEIEGDWEGNLYEWGLSDWFTRLSATFTGDTFYCHLFELDITNAVVYSAIIEGTFSLDASHAPSNIDFHVTMRDGVPIEPYTLLGTYHRDGSHLYLCFDESGLGIRPEPAQILGSIGPVYFLDRQTF